MPGLTHKSGHGPHSSKVVVIVLCYRLSVVIVLCCYLCCSVIMVLFYVLIVCTVTMPPGVNPIAVDKYIYLIIIINGSHCAVQSRLLFLVCYLMTLTIA